MQFRGRFIPTHVGNTPIENKIVRVKTVHPHTRGEYINPMKFAECYNGSSPHTWGIRFFVSGGGETRRFIPTHVGNTTGP